jgi:hypothetical protein
VHYKEELMKFQSTPGRIVNKRIKRQGRYRVINWFKFDADGFATVDTSKLTPTDVSKLKSKFKVIVPKEEETVVHKPMSYKEVQKAYTKATGISGVGKKMKDMLKEVSNE